MKKTFIALLLFMASIIGVNAQNQQLLNFNVSGKLFRVDTVNLTMLINASSDTSSNILSFTLMRFNTIQELRQYRRSLKEQQDLESQMYEVQLQQAQKAAELARRKKSETSSN